MSPIYKCLLFCFPLLLSSCGTTNTKRFFNEFSGPSIKQLGLKKIDPLEVTILPIPDFALKSQEANNRWTSSLRSKGIVQLGASQFNREGQTGVQEIRNFAASIGSRVVYVSNVYQGKGSKTVSVPVSHTPGRTITSNSNTYGTVNTNSQTYGTLTPSYGTLGGGYNYSGNTYGSGSYSGNTSSSTYIPSSTTYAPKQVSYHSFRTIAVFCSPPSALSQTGAEALRRFRAERAQFE